MVQIIWLWRGLRQLVVSPESWTSWLLLSSRTGFTPGLIGETDARQDVGLIGLDRLYHGACASCDAVGERGTWAAGRCHGQYCRITAFCTFAGAVSGFRYEQPG